MAATSGSKPANGAGGPGWAVPAGDAPDVRGDAVVRAVKVQRGLYRLEGVTHTAGRGRGGPVCGGQVFAGWFEGPWDSDFIGGKEFPHKLPDSWECYCGECGDCDPNGWPTLAACKREAPDFWCELTEAKP